MEAPIPAGSGFAPVDPGRRLVHVDMVRGFALFGVLLVNMFNFGATSPMWTDTADQAAFSAMRMFFETKSWRLFSFLFGFGFALQMQRARDQGVLFLPRYLRRLAILFVFGMANALLYDGDILMYYAEMGLILLLFIRVPPRWLLIIAASLMVVPAVQRGLGAVISGPGDVVPAERRVELALQRNAELAATHPYSVGGILDVMAENAEAIPPNPLTDVYGLESSFAYLPMFLLGLYVCRRRIFHEPADHLLLLERVCRWGIGGGLACMMYERVHAALFDYRMASSQLSAPLPQFVGDAVFTFGATALAFGYAAGIVLMSRHVRWRRVVAPLASVGRMALSIYLLQTLMFSTLFYGYGFGRVGRAGPAEVCAWAILFYLLQVLVANTWLGRFRYGPAEWLWRSLTYGRRQPMSLPAEA